MILAKLLNSADIKTALQQSNCPYDCSATDRCTASLSSMTIGSGSRQIYCSTDNYDNCPLFLAKILRRR
jgi:hypothetical protein